MKKQLLTLITLILILLTACENECQVVKDFHKNGQEREVFIYPNCNDTTYYLRKYFYENGLISSEGYFKNGVKIGKFTSWANNGNKTADWEVVDGKEHGFIQCWYDNGIKKRELTVNKGIKDGLYKNWKEDGSLSVEGNYKNGKKEGKWKVWWEDGSWRILNYKNDTLWGFTYEYLIDSLEITQVIGQYENGLETGLWKWFDKDSVLYESVVYENGVINGDYLKYYPDGTLKEKVSKSESDK